MSYVNTLLEVIKNAHNLWWQHYRDCQSLTEWYPWKGLYSFTLCEISNRDC